MPKVEVDEAEWNQMQALRTDWWHDAPRRPLGPHDGVPDPVEKP